MRHEEGNINVYVLYAFFCRYDLVVAWCYAGIMLEPRGYCCGGNIAASNCATIDPYQKGN